MLGIGLGLAQAARHKGGRLLPPEAQALAARMSTAPAPERLHLVSTLIGALKAGAVWSKLDALYILAAHDEQASRLNWVGGDHDLTAVNSPAFTADRGWQGDGTGQYLNSTFHSLIEGAKFRSGSAHMGLWSLTSLRNASGSSYEVGYNSGINSKSFIARHSSVGDVVAYAAMRSGGSANLLMGGSLADHVAWSRLNTSQVQTYRAGLPSGAPTEAPEGGTISSAEFRVCAAGGSFGTNQIAVAHWGEALDDAQMLVLGDALRAYLTNVGAVAP